MSGSKILFVTLALLFVLAFRFILFFTAKPSFKHGELITFTATIGTQPATKGNVQQFEVSTQGQRIRIFVPRFPNYHYGDVVKISGTLAVQNSKDAKGMLSKIHTTGIISFPKVEAKKSQFSFLAVIEKFRQHVIGLIRQSLPSNSAALLGGILFGSKEVFSDDFSAALRNTGTLHVVAASGMNVTILASFFMTILLRFLKRRIAAMCVILAISFYCFLALLQPPIVRASVMGTSVFIASMFNRQAQAVWLLGLAGYTMLFFDPVLIVDIGFQLSFAATLGLLLLMPALEKTFHWFLVLKQVPLFGEGTTTTIVAQIATLPILLGNFGMLSLLSVFVNALVLWTVPAIMLLGIITALLSFLPILAYMVVISALPLLAFFETVVSLFDRGEFLLMIKLPFLAGIGYYCLLIGFYLLVRKKGI